jgi:hypothetical protein
MGAGIAGIALWCFPAALAAARSTFLNLSLPRYELPVSASMSWTLTRIRFPLR